MCQEMLCSSPPHKKWISRMVYFCRLRKFIP
uniref:Uncharacterized protein n=1 Tax=Arundo donax TaxID=35708 RepID=A0A0A9A7J2_ARUDO